MLESGWRLMSRGRSCAVAGTIRRGFAGRIPIAGGVFSASESVRLSVLLVVALFFCHGAFGYAHQLPPGDALAEHVAHMGSGHQPGPDQTSDETHSGGAYFATLLALFFGMFLWLGSKGSTGLKFAVPPVLRRGPGVGVLPPPRGPTPFYLQVFRL